LRSSTAIEVLRGLVFRHVQAPARAAHRPRAASQEPGRAGLRLLGRSRRTLSTGRSPGQLRAAGGDGGDARVAAPRAAAHHGGEHADTQLALAGAQQVVGTVEKKAGLVPRCRARGDRRRRRRSRPRAGRREVWRRGSQARMETVACAWRRRTPCSRLSVSACRASAGAPRAHPEASTTPPTTAWHASTTPPSTWPAPPGLLHPRSPGLELFRRPMLLVASHFRTRVVLLPPAHPASIATTRSSFSCRLTRARRSRSCEAGGIARATATGWRATRAVLQVLLERLQHEQRRARGDEAERAAGGQQLRAVLLGEHRERGHLLLRPGRTEAAASAASPRRGNVRVTVTPDPVRSAP
jgi:hypothetical protein